MKKLLVELRGILVAKYAERYRELGLDPGTGEVAVTTIGFDPDHDCIPYVTKSTSKIKQYTPISALTEVEKVRRALELQEKTKPATRYFTDVTGRDETDVYEIPANQSEVVKGILR